MTGKFNLCTIFKDVGYNEEKLKKFTPKLRQTYVALGPILVTVTLGMAEGYSAILLPQLQNENLMELNLDLKSWIASITALPTPFACFLGGIVMEIIGRKNVHILCSVWVIIGWIIIYFSNTIVPLLIGRFITGFCVGFLGAPTCCYIAETSDPTYRGALMAAISMAITLGIVFVHLLGTVLSWKVIALICCIFPAIALVVMIFAPESPTYLAKKGRINAATDAFYWCRGQDAQSKHELNVLLEKQRNAADAPKQSYREFLKPEFFKPMIILVVFFFTLQWTGNNAMTFYTVTILQQSLHGTFDEYLSLIIIDVVRLLSSLAACYLLKIINRRTLALFSTAGITLTLFSLSGFLFLAKYYTFLEAYSYLLLIPFSLYMIFLGVGLVPLPWTMVGELFPVATRGSGSGVTTMINYALLFSVVKTTPWLFANLNTDGTFLLFGLVGLGGMIYLWIFLPETKDKPLHEIEEYFKGNKSIERTNHI